MNKKILTFGISLLIISLVTATAIYFIFPYDHFNPPKADDSGHTDTGITDVVESNNKFALDIYKELQKNEDGNIFYSPYSIYSALAMTYEGAKENTAKQMKDVFHFPKNEILRHNFAAIYNDINTKNTAYELKTGNALWIQKNYPLVDNYMTSIKNYYGGLAVNLDFVNEAEKSRQTINSFIEKQTNNKIKDLLPKSAIDSATRLILTNAIYFKGNWKWEFDKSKTYDSEFKITQKEKVMVPMMNMKPEKARFNYANLEKLKILELPYKGDKISMLILLPKQEEVYDYETGKKTISEYSLKDIELSFEKLKEYKNSLKETKLDSISIPKFEFETKKELNKELIDLGMPDAFSESADFSGMTGKIGLYIDFVIHQAYIKVDEKGTEAAAATAVGMKEMAMIQTNNFIANHPFIFIIQEKETGNILFMGKVVDPSKK